jgi:hypothetical protein
MEHSFMTPMAMPRRNYLKDWPGRRAGSDRRLKVRTNKPFGKARLAAYQHILPGRVVGRGTDDCYTRGQ